MSQKIKDYKYEVSIIRLEKAMRVPRELSEQLKGVLSAKRIRELKKDAVNCPVQGKIVPFLQCFVCKNFVRRVRGVVHCRGESLQN